MDQVFVYWDNSNVFHEAQRLAEEREGTPGARYLVRIHFENLLRLAEAGRPLAKAVAAGSVPPEMRQLWNRMENRGVQVRLFDRGEKDRGRTGSTGPLVAAMHAGRWLGQQRRSGHRRPAHRRRCGLRRGGRASTAPWNGCTSADGGWRCSPGRIRATGACADGRRRTGCSCPWTTTTRRSPSASRPARGTSSRQRGTRRRWTCRAAAWRNERRLPSLARGREPHRGRGCVARAAEAAQ